MLKGNEKPDTAPPAKVQDGAGREPIEQPPEQIQVMILLEVLSSEHFVLGWDIVFIISFSFPET